MSVTLKTWTKLGLGSALAGATLAACSPSEQAEEPAAEAEVTETATEPEAEVVETEVAAPVGEGEGEGGEGEGGVSISAANTDPVVYNAALAITEAHIIAARDAHALGETDAAAEMFAHPVSEVLFDMEEVFVARGVEDFSDMLTEASLAVINGADANEVATKSDAIIATLRAAAEKAPDNGQTQTQIGAGVAADQIERAADMYLVAAGDEAYEPYLDGYGFYKAGEAAFNQVSADLATSDPESATAITAALALLGEAYPSAVRPDSLDQDTAALTVAASNVVLAVGN
ncbi:MAG: hypothetical protein AAGI14_03895 [Pseudomonadota bacterium]